MNCDDFFEAERLEKIGQKEEAFNVYSRFIAFAEECMLNCKTTSSYPNCQSIQEKLALAYNNRGLLNYQNVEFKAAKLDYTKALEYNPNLAVAFYNRGLIHYRLSNFQVAVEDMERALFLKPDFEHAQKCLQQSMEDLKMAMAKETCTSNLLK
ncbi:tetratricopeptide repeat protein 32-like [Pomacea canaliculata]|uniref:tetratricopeptide repeat protein 32-like n=1 Tax=Pomacea canaliculata TaxID=400727 RepID=UPI000D73CEC5|nr:tetratricopeptide repeat protein 32-like [Pomacea canaliculata]